MGDFTRDIDRNILPEPVLAGIQMHFSIDAFTDSHPLVIDLRKKFSRERRRFAGVILDVVFDHFLIKHWSTFIQVDLDAYIQKCYDSLWRHRKLMPPRMEMVVSWMIARNWIKSYSELSGVGRALDGLAGQLKRQHGFHGSIQEVEQLYDRIETGFLAFFPQLDEHVKVYLDNS